MSDFETNYEKLLQEYMNKLSIPNWFISGIKTLLDRNITIEDWNRMYSYLERLASDNEVQSKILALFKDKFVSIDEEFSKYVTKTLLDSKLLIKADKKDIPTKLSQLEKDVELGAVISLGEIRTSPNIVNNEKLNSVTNPGVYTFTSTESYSGGYFVNANVYFMVVERTDTDDRAVEQFIYSCDVPRDSTNTLSNLSIIRRIKSRNTGTWTVNSIAIPSQEYVDKKIAKLIAEEVDSSPETLNTLKELADALKENEGVVEVLNSAITNKADKKDIPTKLSQLEQDITVGGDFDGKKITLKDEDNGFTIDLDASSGKIIFTDTGAEAGEFYVTPYNLSVGKAGNYIGLNLEDGITFKADKKYVTLSTNQIFTQKEGEQIKNFYFPNKSGTLALEEQMQEMIVDIIWDENDEAFIELGNNVIDWSRPVLFELSWSNGKSIFPLEWSIYEKTVKDYSYMFGMTPDDYTLILNGFGFYSSGSKFRVDTALIEHYDASYIYFCDTGNIENIQNYTKMKVYYYPVNENSPTVKVEM